MKKNIILNLMLYLIVSSMYAQIQKGQTFNAEAIGDKFGIAVSMPDYNTIAVGAMYNDGYAFNAGHVRVYSWNGFTWIQKGMDIDGEAANDHFGTTVSMPDSNTIAIAAPENDGSATDAGRVKIYRWNGSSWIQKGTSIDGVAAYDHSGLSITMPDSNTIAIGAPDNDNYGNGSGHVRIYHWNGTVWIQKGNDIGGESIYDASGWSISMPDSNTIAIGAPYNDGNGSDAGHVRIYRWNGAAWVQKGNDIDGGTTGDHFGSSVSMPDPNTVAIGAPENNDFATDAGQVKIYRWNGSNWIQKGTAINGEASGDFSGTSISMPDSNTVAIGAPLNDGNGSNAGHVRIYRWNGNSWIQKGIGIDGDANDDWLGKAVNMPDSNTVAIGAPYNDGNGTNAGQAKVYSMECFSIYYPTTVSACNSYTSPSGNYTWTSSGNYSDTLTTTAGCDSVILINLTINTIDTTLSVSGNNITANQNGATYQWLSCDSNFAFTSTADTNQTYSPTVNGNYAVQISLNGCIDTSSCVNIMIVGISQNTDTQLLSLFPNPAQGKVHIIATQKTTIKITDCTGRIIQTETIIPGKNYTVKLPGKGIYFISGTTNDKQMFIKKIINY